mmetsp:Transcript_10031/g.30828  ORF Transcript_10031/g.30828 Transcript_10031/m.30828 type:complete len:267 (-) Transcript_10031:504-1304(-)
MQRCRCQQKSSPRPSSSTWLPARSMRRRHARRACSSTCGAARARSRCHCPLHALAPRTRPLHTRPRCPPPRRHHARPACARWARCARPSAGSRPARCSASAPSSRGSTCARRSSCPQLRRNRPQPARVALYSWPLVPRRCARFVVAIQQYCCGLERCCSTRSHGCCGRSITASSGACCVRVRRHPCRRKRRSSSCSAAGCVYSRQPIRAPPGSPSGLFRSTATVPSLAVRRPPRAACSGRATRLVRKMSCYVSRPHGAPSRCATRS